jgi:hypothetical protein
MVLGDEIRLHWHTQVLLGVLSLASYQVLNCTLCLFEYSLGQPFKTSPSHLHCELEIVTDLLILKFVSVVLFRFSA